MENAKIGEFTALGEVDALKLQVHDLRLQLIQAQRVILEYQHRDETAAREGLISAATAGGATDAGAPHG
ncbi:hypothetical protein LGM75_27750 [Burkholderia multivorans]|uniref:hypothetical protein n=1 Tax=Burkholderia multivorans TaxID=87883 RepID=UPI001C246C5E|nr:hypothetical protein [Burkholderia multivorans]MBU9469115.1 hypothetical protein [Burkholderia multivorans]MCA8130151.1 hypothetical protein [Burkholderia multivorans]